MLMGLEPFILSVVHGTDRISVLPEILLKGLRGRLQDGDCREPAGHIGRSEAGNFQRDDAFGAAADDTHQKDAQCHEQFFHRTLPASLFSESISIARFRSSGFRTFPSPVFGSSGTRKYSRGTL